MIPVSKLRPGTTYGHEGKAYQVIEYKHTKMGRGGATIRVKSRNLQNGAIEEKTFDSGNSVESVDTQKRQLQYLYSDGSNCVFMDNASFEQIEVPTSLLGERSSFLKEGQEVNLLFLNFEGVEKVIDVDLPPKVVLRVTETDPGVKGNSATNVYKPAKLENGLSLRVPLFVNVGDKIRVDTRTGDYVERATEK